MTLAKNIITISTKLQLCKLNISIVLQLCKLNIWPIEHDTLTMFTCGTFIKCGVNVQLNDMWYVHKFWGQQIIK